MSVAATTKAATSITAGHLKILILGGYGTFGGRLARLLATEARLTLIIAGRSAEKAAAFCSGLGPGADKIALAFDRRGDVEAQLRRIRPDIVVDATGPFQSYGRDPYSVVEAAIALGIHYLDLADGSVFVKGVARFDEAARAQRIFVLSGASSFPVLTAAVTRRLAQGMARIDSITGGIAPSPYAGVGRNVIRAIAGYAGQKTVLLRDGKTTTGYALTETRRYIIAPPGHLPLRRLRFSLVDVPELRILPEEWPTLRSVWMGAGPVPDILHRALSALAWTVRLGLLPSLEPLSGLFYHAVNILRWGEHRGGMFVSVEGLESSGKVIEKSWHLVAEGDDGPFIPSMTVEGIIRRCLIGKMPSPGARSAVAELDLDDYAGLFAGRTIRMGFRCSPSADARAPLYRRILGDAWMSLSEPLRHMHDVAGRTIATGLATVERGSSWPARLIAGLFRFPRAGRDVPVTVTFDPNDCGELWTRRFADRAFSSFQSAGRGRYERLIIERFGPFAFALALVAAEGRLDLVVRAWSLWGLPLPLMMAPRGEAYESAADGKFHFHVEIAHRLTGLIIRYQGSLVRQH